MQYKKVQKSSWNEPYSSSSFTKQSCSIIIIIFIFLPTSTKPLAGKLG